MLRPRYSAAEYERCGYDIAVSPMGSCLPGPIVHFTCIFACRTRLMCAEPMCSGSKKFFTGCPPGQLQYNKVYQYIIQYARNTPPWQVPDFELCTFSRPLKTHPALGATRFASSQKTRIVHMKLHLAGALICSSPTAGWVDK